MQFQVTTAALPHAGAGPNDALHAGGGTQETEAEAMALAPPAPTALMVQVSPATPTGSAADPVQSTAPLEGVEPVQT